jgi:hypothetical protein
MKFYGTRKVERRDSVDLADDIAAIIYNESCLHYRIMDQLLTYAHYSDVEAQREELHTDDIGRVELAVERLTKAHEVACSIILIRGE